MEDGYLADYEGKGRIPLGRIIRIWLVRLVIQLVTLSLSSTLSCLINSMVCGNQQLTVTLVVTRNPG